MSVIKKMLGLWKKEQKSIKVNCANCGQEYELNGIQIICPKCKSNCIKIEREAKK